MKKKKTIDTNTNMNQLLELSNKEFRPAITKIPQPGITSALETNDRNIEKQNIEQSQQEIEVIKK